MTDPTRVTRVLRPSGLPRRALRPIACSLVRLVPEDERLMSIPTLEPLPALEDVAVADELPETVIDGGAA